MGGLSATLPSLRCYNITNSFDDDAGNQEEERILFVVC